MRKNIFVAATASLAANCKKLKRTEKSNLVHAAILFILFAGMALSAQAQTFSVLHQFNQPGDGAFSEGSVLRDAAGNIFGTTTSPGIMFKINRQGQESTFALFNGGELGIFPTGALTQDAAGNIYGIAEGGTGGAGTLYKVSPTGQGTVLFAFQGGLTNTDPKLPAGGVLLGPNGNIFGAAQFGNSQACQIGCGSIFRLDSANQLHSLHNFTGRADGSNPIGPLVRDADGNLFGVAQSGGRKLCPEFFLAPGTGCGVVFKIDSQNRFTILHKFRGQADGAVPQGGLLLDGAGNLFGTTLKGGIDENGTIFKITKSGAYSVLHRFTQAEGQNPNGGLVADPAGNLFGTAQLGGDQQLGTAFELSPDGRLQVIHSFQGLEDGASPFAGFFRDQAGHLYGTTVHNFLIQSVQGGNVFEITP